MCHQLNLSKTVKRFFIWNWIEMLSPATIDVLPAIRKAVGPDVSFNAGRSHKSPIHLHSPNDSWPCYWSRSGWGDPWRRCPERNRHCKGSCAWSWWGQQYSFYKILMSGDIIVHYCPVWGPCWAQVGVGKPYLYGLCAGGSEGVIKVGLTLS